MMHGRVLMQDNAQIYLDQLSFKGTVDELLGKA